MVSILVSNLWRGDGEEEEERRGEEEEEDSTSKI